MVSLFRHCFNIEEAPRLLTLMIWTGKSAALIAPAFPMARVPTGMPPGICAIDSKLSKPFKDFVSMGTPKTGTVVRDAVMPGR